MAEALIETPAGFDKLSKVEKLRYLQALWDQISEQPDDIPVPESHLQLVENRLRHYRDNPSASLPASKVIERLGE